MRAAELLRPRSRIWIAVLLFAGVAGALAYHVHATVALPGLGKPATWLGLGEASRSMVAAVNGVVVSLTLLIWGMVVLRVLIIPGAPMTMIGTGEPLDGRASITLGLNGCVAEALTLFEKLR